MPHKASSTHCEILLSGFSQISLRKISNVLDEYIQTSANYRRPEPTGPRQFTNIIKHLGGSPSQSSLQLRVTSSWLWLTRMHLGLSENVVDHGTVWDPPILSWFGDPIDHSIPYLVVLYSYIMLYLWQTIVNSATYFTCKARYRTGVPIRTDLWTAWRSSDRASPRRLAVDNI